MTSEPRDPPDREHDDEEDSSADATGSRSVRGAFEQRAYVRYRNVLFAVLVVFSAAFIGSSTYQLGVGVFGAEAAEASSRAAAATHARESLSPGCADALGRLHGALDAAAAEAVTARSEVDGAARYERAVDPTWNTLEKAEQACSGGAEHEALAALSRLRQAQERALRRQWRELAPLHRDFQAHLGR